MDATQWHARLAVGHWFSQLPVPFQHSLLAHARLRQLTAGQYLFKRGDPPWRRRLVSSVAPCSC